MSAVDGGPGIRFGAAYYHEYQPSPRLEEDFDLMAAAGFTVIRVGESVWSTWEPEPGVFDLDWLEPVLDAAHARGIGVILGTPTYAIPMWMKRLHPEVAGDSATGVPIPWGSRQEMDFTNPAYLFYAERIIRAVVGRYRDHPAIIGYQVDNEPGLRLLFNEGIFQRFVDHLRHTYGDVETLNREWGLVYWSHRLSTWADLWRPDGNFQPQYDLAWRRFQAQLVTEFIGWQAGIVREFAQPGQFVTTCISYDQVGVEDVDLSAELDIASGNAYYEMQDSLAHPSTDERSTGWIVKGTWALYQLADLMFSSKQAPFLITETNASSIGHSSLNFSPYDGQWRQAAWALVARGARMVEYWHWHTLHFGVETYWGGVLPHSQVPGRTYAELARLGAEFARAGDRVARSVPDADVAVLYDSDSKFALSSQAPFGAPGQYLDPDSYRRIVAAFYRGAFDAGLQARLVRPQQLFASRGADTEPCRLRGRASGARRSRVLHGRRRRPRLARRLRCRRRPPRARPAHRVRRPRGPRPHRRQAVAADRRGRRHLRRVREPRETGAGRWRRRLRRGTGCGSHRLGGRPHPRRRRPPSPTTGTRTSAAGPPSRRTSTAPDV